jgi:hypothetical protein
MNELKGLRDHANLVSIMNTEKRLAPGGYENKKEHLEIGPVN